jgi:16S rRNA (uracil1498-N3)-methyltransferase
MALPYFFVEQIPDTARELVLDEDVSKHVVQVLRMEKGEALLLTDGKGRKAKTIIVDDHRKRCTVRIEHTEQEERPANKTTIAISIIKNSTRFEWFLEKATEIGIQEIIPLICDRTEKEKFRIDRMKNILVSAMLQSQQCWLPLLHQPIPFDDVIKADYSHKFIAHCLPHQKQQLATEVVTSNKRPSSIILIGPEGDFTEKEIADSLQADYMPVALGNTRLRTETAGMVAAALLANY